MEKESNSWFPYQQFELPPSYSNISGSPVLRGQLPALMNPYMKGVCANGAIPMAPYSGLPLSEARQPIEHYNWFYGIPCFRQTFASPLAKEKLASHHQIDNYGVNGNGKQFLVFDKSGDQTSLIYSSGIRTPTNCLTSWNLVPRTSVGVIKEELLRKEIANPKVSSFQNLDGYSQGYPEDVMKNQSFDGIRCISPGMISPEGVIEDEMHEDTEELNALLYSDDENDYSEDDDDDDVTSTGHSPNTMIDHVIHNLAEDEDEDEEVASSACSFKRYKLLDGAYDVPPLVHVSAIKKPSKSSDLDNDAESYCSNFDNQVSGGSSVSGKKRSRSENIRTKLSILQNIIPGTKGKNPTVVIDEAVQYLKFLKDKAKSFGLDLP